MYMPDGIYKIKPRRYPYNLTYAAILLKSFSPHLATDAINQKTNQVKQIPSCKQFSPLLS